MGKDGWGMWIPPLKSWNRRFEGSFLRCGRLRLENVALVLKPAGDERKILRIYAGEDGLSHFEDTEVDFSVESERGERCELHKATGIVFRRTGPGYRADWHKPPGRTYVISLQGTLELTVGSGAKRILEPGQVLLAENTTEQGHRTPAIGRDARLSLFVTLDQGACRARISAVRRGGVRGASVLFQRLAGGFCLAFGGPFLV